MLLLAALSILGGVLLVAMGGGGEMALFHRDLPIALTRPRTPAEVATQRLPLGPIGYQVQATEEALVSAANLLAERDQEIDALRSQIWRLTEGARQAGGRPADAEADVDGYGYPVSVGDDGPADQVDEPSAAPDEEPAAGLAGTDPSWRQ